MAKTRSPATSMQTPSEAAASPKLMPAGTLRPPPRPPPLPLSTGGMEQPAADQVAVSGRGPAGSARRSERPWDPHALARAILEHGACLALRRLVAARVNGCVPGAP